MLESCDQSSPLSINYFHVVTHIEKCDHIFRKKLQDFIKTVKKEFTWLKSQKAFLTLMGDIVDQKLGQLFTCIRKTIVLKHGFFDLCHGHGTSTQHGFNYRVFWSIYS